MVSGIDNLGRRARRSLRALLVVVVLAHGLSASAALAAVVNSGSGTTSYAGGGNLGTASQLVCFDESPTLCDVNAAATYAHGITFMELDRCGDLAGGNGNFGTGLASVPVDGAAASGVLSSLAFQTTDNVYTTGTYCLYRDSVGNFWSIVRLYGASIEDSDIQACAPSDTFDPALGCTPAASPSSSSRAPASQNQKSANKSAGAAFSRPSNLANTFITQRQTQDRLLRDDRDREQIGLAHNGERQRTDSHDGNATLAMAYAKSIERPGDKTTWHSKDIINSLRQRHATKRGKTEQYTRQGRHGLGFDASSETVQPPAFQSNYDVWMAGGITKVDSSRTGNVFDGTLRFGRVGFDYLAGDRLLLGMFGGYDKADAKFSSLDIDLDSDGKIIGGYFGLKLTPIQTGLPVNLILDGQVSYGLLDYGVKDIGNATTGSFDAMRVASTVSLTAVILQSMGRRGVLRWLPKVGVSYVEEDQDGYTDSGGSTIVGQRITLGQLTFGTQLIVPITRALEVSGRAEGQWDFDDIGTIATSTGTAYRPGTFGVILGVGARAQLSETATLRLEGTSEGIARKDYDQYNGTARVDVVF